MHEAGQTDSVEEHGMAAALAELERLRALTADSGRPAAVARRHAAGGLTARENLAALVDPGTLIEYGRLAVAAQRARRGVDELHAQTPADGLVAMLGRVNGELFGDRAWCALLAYDYTVLAGTQGAIGHRKKDRLFELVERLRLPVVFFAEGGGGRPGDTDFPVASALDVRAFALWGRLDGVVPRIAIVHGRCFAGNAVIAGASDLIVATRSASLGMGGPAMIQAGGLGSVDPDDVGPAEMHAETGTVDVLVDDERAAATLARKLLAFFQGRTPPAESAAEGLALRSVVPARRRRAFDVRRVFDALFDHDSVVYLRERHAPELVTALARIEGRPLGVIANNSQYLAGVITAAAADKASDLMRLCDRFGLPIVSLIDTPGFMVGPEHERTGLVRRASRMLATGSKLRVPLIAVVLRRAFGLGAQAMAGGSLHEPLLTVAWAGAELGPMNLEGAVRLALRRELEQIGDPEERERLVREATRLAEEQGSAFNAARLFEVDEVIDPAETRPLVASALAAASAHSQP
ncbi:Acetyl-CoA carboxylase, carboxyltransferase component [Thermoleophilum album]|uniref:Acetyl-CoA carboxylase, carboxyltransferase component n=2 Tax=Thermoleophilum album TaxID=29539 RepID=A0A1H6FJC5_THEAL|nr:carboxyl transferase domain-containing protein [Thermoleophilum album]SEH10951.1 Acetyl-CoA carboxylase, carboxyltransferase component [Thermoleophilum album]